jgi:aryl-alcohol dehydrogenase-like predicted oxidoreductase
MAPGKASHYRTDVGATKLHHLNDALASVAVKLTAEELAALEEPYVPHAVVGVV